jgi:hypothetical protein
MSSIDQARTHPAVSKSRTKSIVSTSATIITATNHHNSRTGRPTSKKSMNVLLICFIVAGTVMIVISWLGSSILMNDSTNAGSSSAAKGTSTTNAIQHSLQKMQQPRPTIIEVDDLDHEGIFRKVIKSCVVPTNVKNSKCATYLPDWIDTKSTARNSTENGEKVKTKIQRIAILAPPGDLSGSLINRVERIVEEYNTMIEQQSTQQKNNKVLDEVYETKMELVVTSHVPPYGYGKTHGYTKIIRLIPEPLLLEVTDALTAVLRPGESHTQITLTDLKQAVRQILRFHCRINHVSAHTAVLSIKFMDLFADPIGTTQQIRSFIFPPVSDQQTPQLRRNNIEKDKSASQQKDDDSNKAGEGVVLTEEEEEAQSMDDDQGSLMDAELAYGSQILTNIQQHGVDGGRTNVTVGSTILDILDVILLQEFHVTKDMSMWPCLSFWKSSQDEPQSKQAIGMSEIVKRLAQNLSPDCNDPYNTCFVQRDQCEFVDDAECANSKRKR